MSFKVNVSMKRIISGLTTVLCLYGCSSMEDLLTPDFLNPPPKARDSYENPNFSKCRLLTGAKTNEGPSISMEFMNIKNKISGKEDMFFVVYPNTNNAIWNSYKANIGNHITFITENDQKIEVDLKDDSITQDKVKVQNKVSKGMIGYLSQHDVEILKNSTYFKFTLTMSPDAQARYQNGLTGEISNKRLKIVWNHCS